MPTMPFRFSKYSAQMLFALVLALAASAQAQDAHKGSRANVERLASLIALLAKGEGFKQASEADRSVLMSAFDDAYQQQLALRTSEWPMQLRIGVVCSLVQGGTLDPFCEQHLVAPDGGMPSKEDFKPQSLLEATRFGVVPQRLIDLYENGLKNTHALRLQREQKNALDKRELDAQKTLKETAGQVPPVLNSGGSKIEQSEIKIDTWFVLFLLLGCVGAWLLNKTVFQKEEQPKAIAETLVPVDEVVPELTHEQKTAQAELLALRSWAKRLARSLESVRQFVKRNDALLSVLPEGASELASHKACLSGYVRALEHSLGLVQGALALRSAHIEPLPSNQAQSYEWEALGSVLSSCAEIEAWLAVREQQNTALYHWVQLAVPAILGVHYKWRYAHKRSNALVLSMPVLLEEKAPMTIGASLPSSNDLMRRITASALKNG